MYRTADSGKLFDYARRSELGTLTREADEFRALAHAAIAEAGLSRAPVHRRVTSGAVPARTEPDGSLSIASRDVRLLRPRERSEGDATGRLPIQLRPDLERYAAWEAAAGDQPVSVWLCGLADTASGWKQ